MKINGRKIIYWQIEINLIIKLIAQIIPALGILEYSIDILNILLLAFIIIKIVKQRKLFNDIKFIKNAILILFFYDVIRSLFTHPDPLLFIWGLRNQYRFLILFIAVCLFWTVDDISILFDKLYYLLLVNTLVITLEFIAGYRGDYLGGTFGLEKNVNAITNIFLCILVSYGIIGNMYKKMSAQKTMTILFVSLYWAALAEIKIFFVEFVIIAAILFFCVHGHSLSKAKWLGSMGVFFIVGLIALTIVFPEQTTYIINPRNTIWYLTHVHGGAHGFGRLSALGITNETFFQNALSLKVGGIGVGNAEFMNIGTISIVSDFYKKYSEYSYFGYFHSMVYIERGIIGLAWYAIFWIKTFTIVVKNLKIHAYKMWAEYSLVFLACVFIVALKDSTLRISISGYLVSIFMAVPYLFAKRQEEIKQ